MNLLSRLHYYFIAMRSYSFAPVTCPVCATDKPEPLLGIDRYLLPIQVAICRGCSLVYTSRNVSGAALQAFYRDHYRRFYENANRIDDNYLFRHKPKLNAAFRMLRIRELKPNFESVLEIGSGLGYFLDECRAFGVKNIAGIEPGDAFRAYSRTVLDLGDKVSGEPYEQAGSLPFAPDLVAMFHVLEHVEDPAACLRWIRERIANGGMLVIEVPDITGNWFAMGLGNFHIGHRWYFSPRTLNNLMVRNGWMPILVQRDDGDGIYQGNLRMFALPAVPADTNLMPGDNIPALASRIRENVHLSSLRIGWPRAALRLFKQALHKSGPDIDAA